MPSLSCPLCAGAQLALQHQQAGSDGPRVYWHCVQCGLIFLDPAHHLSPDKEKQRYDTHQNGPQYSGYVNFLKQLTVPLSRVCPAGAQGLDFGCGPGPAIDVILREAGLTVTNYDPFYFPNENLLKTTYDFITCTEAAEHFYHPRVTFDLLAGLLKPQGVLGVMTHMFEEGMDFAQWWYPKDVTHVCFYQRRTFEWLAAHYQWTASFPAAHVVLLLN